MKVAFIKKILAGFLICSIILLVVGIFSFEASNKFIRANKSVNHTHEVIYAIQKSILGSAAATMNGRGYIRTGDKKFIEAYLNAKEETIKHFSNLAFLKKDPRDPQLKLDTIEILFNKLVNFYERGIDLRKSNKVAEAMKLLQSNQGLIIETGLNAILYNALQAEENLLAEQMKQSEAEAAKFKVISVLFIATVLIIIIIIYVAIVVRTKRFRKSEEALTKTISDYKFALDESGIVAVTDEKGIIKHVNDNFCVISKYYREELIGRDNRIINSGYHPEEFIRDLWVTIANGRIWKGELKNKAKDGTFYWVDTTIVPFLDAYGKPYQYMAIHSDITQRKKTEEAVLESKVKLDNEAKALEELNDAGIRLWRTGNLTDGLRAMLCYSTKIFGTGMGNVQIYDEERKVLIIAASKGFSQAFLDYFHEVSAEDGTACADAFKKRHQVVIEDVDKDEGLALHLHIMHAAGVKSVQSTPLFNSKGEPVGMISTHLKTAGPFDPFCMRIMELYARKAESFIARIKISDDLRELNQNLEAKVTERTLELTQTLEREKELNEMKSRFVSTASHEFRTPLSTILSSVFLVESFHKDEQKEKRDKHISRIRSSVRSLVDILDDFLSLDKLEQGKMEIKKEFFNLNDFSKGVVEEMNDILKQGQSISFVYRGENEIVQDKKVLKNVFLNLLSNAIKYSEENKEIQFLIEVGNDELLIKVKDEGIGIPEEEQKNLFNKFYRARNVATIQGTGLGLNIVKKYVELMDGAISFESKLNLGTIFTVKIPQNKNM